MRQERILLVLIGTNNLGGVMTPDQTARGIDAVGRMILRMQNKTRPDVPAAMQLVKHKSSKYRNWGGSHRETGHASKVSNESNDYSSDESE